MIIEGAHVVTVTGAEIPGGYVVVEGNRITALDACPASRGDHAVVDGMAAWARKDTAGQGSERTSAERAPFTAELTV
jgi:hypothetical protein